MHYAVFGAACLVLAAFLRKRPDVFTSVVGRVALFLGILLVVGSLFDGLWDCLIFGRLYYRVASSDFDFDFKPVWPITQGAIDAASGSERGQLFGITLFQLQLVWGLFALGTWGITASLYWLIRRYGGRVAEVRMGKSMKNLLFLLKLLGQSVLLLFSWLELLVILSMFFRGLSGMNPPGAPGLSPPFLLLTALSIWLFYGFARWFRSSAPSIGAAFVVAAMLSTFAFIDSNTNLSVIYGYTTWARIYLWVLCCGVVIFVLLLRAVYVARARSRCRSVSN
ncbi:MAG TPA: hypothetical protein VMV72_17835 [Verrucomicrobiae bacterium]|nr:hypothetical protein [Verrucomicrobiae bacterium]